MSVDRPVLSPAQRRALRATARIACLAGLAGCPAKTTPPPAAEPVDQVTPPPTEPVAPRLPIGTTWVPEGSPELSACVDTVTATFAGGTVEDVPTEARTCCEKLATAADAAKVFSFPQRYGCCTALGWQGSSACTPWGPPVPPSLPVHG